MAKPNVVYIHSHDTGRFVQPYGYAIRTPHIQRFAEQGVLFRQAFCAAPSCSPSRAALLTGQFPHCCGMHGLAGPQFDGFALHDYSHHLARFLGSHGYETALAGIQHEAREPWASLDALGYEHWLTERPEVLSGADEAAARFLDQPHDRPFFLAVGFNETHRKNRAGGAAHCDDDDFDPDTADGRYCRPPEAIPDTPLTRKDMANLTIGSERLDERVGRVLAAIDRNGLADNTFVIVTTDHGIAWPHGKGNLTDMGLGVMLMMRGPRDGALGERYRGGKVFDALVSHMDVYPTLCEAIGVDKPSWLQGCSLNPLLGGEADQVRPHIFGEQAYHCHRFDPQRSVRTERYKYIRRTDVPHLRIIDPGPTNNWMHELGYPKQPAEGELLYDLYFDPTEAHNLIDSPAHAAVRDELRAALDSWMIDTDDPFRTNSIPKPPALLAKEAGNS